jgi:hypothetical protein
MAMNKQQWTLVSGLGLGAGLMYLLDPQGGGRRRALARDKAVSAWSSGSDVVRKTSRDLGNRSKGLAASVQSKLRKEDADDLILRERVRSKLGRWVSHPSAIEVEVAEGVVTLRGPVLSSEAAHLLKKVAKVKGVEDVRDELDLRESTEGVSGLQADEELSQNGSRSWSPAMRVLAGTAGGALTLAALKRRDKLGAALGTVALGLLASSATGTPQLNPARLMKLRGRRSDTLEESGDGQLQSDSSSIPVSKSGDGMAGHDHLTSLDSENFGFEPSRAH